RADRPGDAGDERRRAGRGGDRRRARRQGGHHHRLSGPSGAVAEPVPGVAEAVHPARSRRDDPLAARAGGPRAAWRGVSGRNAVYRVRAGPLDMSLANSANTPTTGLKVRFFKVTIPTGHGSIATSTGRTFSPRLAAQ